MKIHTVIGTLLLSVLSVGCAGATVKTFAADLEYPVSLSKALYTESGEVIVPDEASYVGHFSKGYSAWSVLWTQIPLSDDNDIAEMLGKEVEKHGGDGIVNLKVSAVEDVFFALTSWIPVMPHAVYYNIEGDVVTLP